MLDFPRTALRLRGDDSGESVPTRTFAQPTALNQNRPLFRLWARGSPAFCFFFRLPRKRGGWRADRAQCPDYSGRVVRITPDVGCTYVHPRLAARQRGILAFMPLTVVGPGRVASARRGCPSTARGRGCVSHRSQVPLPLPACRTPPEGAPRRVDRDMSRLAKISPDVKSRFGY